MPRNILTGQTNGDLFIYNIFNKNTMTEYASHNKRKKINHE